MLQNSHKVLIVAGPTASGKSSLALDLALACNGEIINADSMQVYKDIPILSACPSAKDMEKVPHHLYQIYDASYNGNVVDWLDLAVEKIRLCWQKDKIPVVVGGTGLYLDNLIRGTTPVPEVPYEVKENVRALCRSIGLRKMHDKLEEVDPVAAAKIQPGDMSRIFRAYGVFLHSGIPFSTWQTKPIIKKLPEANFLVTTLFPSKEELDERCFNRFDYMISHGALAEVVKLAERNLPDTLPVMKALGVPELMMFLRGEVSLDEAIVLGKIHTRQYAKRQRTWFFNKLRSDFFIKECYYGQKNLINSVKKRL